MEDYVAGYFIGSETYIPAKEFRMSPDINYNWTYAYEKDWAWHQMWGRLMYNPDLPDAFFVDQFEYRYRTEVGKTLIEALQLGSKMPLALASFYQGTWDFTLYCEGFLNGKQLYRNYKEADEAFIRIYEMITHQTLDYRYLNIKEFVDRKINNKVIEDEEITPLELAVEMETNGNKILSLCNDISQFAVKDSINFSIEQNDIKAWAHLSLYFADKLIASVNLDEARKTKSVKKQKMAIAALESATKHWLDLIESTKQYDEVSLLHIRNFKFTWKMYYPKVLKDIEIAQDLSIKK